MIFLDVDGDDSPCTSSSSTVNAALVGMKKRTAVPVESLPSVLQICYENVSTDLNKHTLEMLAFLKCNLRLVPVPKPVAETVMISLRKQQ